jgi:hypothetical protein
MRKDHVKKPGCPARKSGDEWPKWLFLWKKPRAEAQGFFTSPYAFLEAL